MEQADSVSSLVERARDGDQSAWDSLVERYLPLVCGTIARTGLYGAEAEDVNQTVWLRLVEHLDSLREARALPMWIITTGRREAWRYLSTGRRIQPRDPADLDWVSDPTTDATPEDRLVRSERQQALLAGLAELSPRDRELMLMFLEDPSPSYAEISRRTGMPVGGIGPTRARVLEKLRRTPALQAVATCGSECCGSAARAKG